LPTKCGCSRRGTPPFPDPEGSVSQPNERWVANFTYVATWSEIVYAAFVVDVFSRVIVGWSAATSKRPRLPRSSTIGGHMAGLNLRRDGCIGHKRERLLADLGSDRVGVAPEMPLRSRNAGLPMSRDPMAGRPGTT
jgi:transposase InsO family protein